jgi:hypothetical protein
VKERFESERKDLANTRSYCGNLPIYIYTSFKTRSYRSSALVAQLVARRSDKAKVIGSSPVESTLPIFLSLVSISFKIHLYRLESEPFFFLNLSNRRGFKQIQVLNILKQEANAELPFTQ